MKHDEFSESTRFSPERLANHLSSHGEVGGRAQEALPGVPPEGRTRRSGTPRVVCRHPGGSRYSSYPVDPFLVAAKLTPDSVLSHHTAAGFTERLTRFIHTSRTRHPARLDL